MALKHRPPWHQRELARLLNDGIFSAGKLDGAAERTLYSSSGSRFGIGQAKFLRQLASNTVQFSLAQDRKHVGSIDDPILFFMRVALRDQPLPPASLRLSHVAAEAGSVQRLGSIGNQLPVEPGGAVEADLSLQRH